VQIDAATLSAVIEDTLRLKPSYLNISGDKMIS
jgi:hypothetical protein